MHLSQLRRKYAVKINEHIYCSANALLTALNTFNVNVCIVQYLNALIIGNRMNVLQCITVIIDNSHLHRI